MGREDGADAGLARRSAQVLSVTDAVEIRVGSHGDATERWSALLLSALMGSFEKRGLRRRPRRLQ